MANIGKVVALKVAAPKANLSVKPLTMPAHSLKVGVGVKAQHMPKINWGKVNAVKQKGTGQ